MKIFHDIVSPNGESDREEVETTYKRWGTEHLVTNTEKYCAKIMTIEPGTRVSLHYHMKKEETFILISGQLMIETINGSAGKEEKYKLAIMGDSLTLKPGTAHTFYTPDNQLGPTVFIEASTQDFSDDSYRIYPSKGKDADSGGSDS